MAWPLNQSLRVFGALCAVAGICLFGLAAAGQWTPLGKGTSFEKRTWEHFEPELVAHVRDYAELMGQTDSQLTPAVSTDAARMKIMYDLIMNRFTHDEALHTPASNWILYLAGFIHPTFRHIWNPEILVSHGSSLFCDQSSYLLLRLAMAHGFKTRHVGLQGHVVMEAWHDGDWHLYDPDLEVLPLDAAGKVLSIDALAQDEALLQKYYGPHPGMADLIRNRENHLYMSTPEGARFEWKGNLLAILEKVTEVLKFVIPVLMLAFGLWLMRFASSLKHALTAKKAPARLPAKVPAA